MICLKCIAFATILLDFAVLADDSNCPTGWTNSAGFCYKFTPGLYLPWADAEAKCLNDGGQLPIISSQYEQDAYIDYRKSLPQQGDPLWIGIYLTNDSVWQFGIDQGLTPSPFPGYLYQNWKGGNIPLGNPGMCIQAEDEGSDIKWSPQACTFPLSFICEMTPLTGRIVYPPNATTSGGGGGGGGGGSGSGSVGEDEYIGNMTSYNWTTGDYMFQNWRKIYPDSKYTDTQFMRSVGKMEHARSVVSCAILCTNVIECVAFNHRASDNDCIFILKEVNDTDVAVDVGWDVWVEGYRYP